MAAYQSVTWTSGDLITEAKMDNMVANDQSEDAHAANGYYVDNSVKIKFKDSGGSTDAEIYEDSNNIVQHVEGSGGPTRGIRRAFAWYIEGTVSVGNELGAKYLVPHSLTVQSIFTKLGAGTATVRVQKDTSDVDAGISVTNSYAEETAITSAELTKGQVISIDVTAASGASDLIVLVECK